MKNSFLLIAFMTIFISCNQHKYSDKVSIVLNEWKENRMLFPFEHVEDKISLSENEYLIVNYMDSAGCLSCNFRVKEWNMLLKEFGRIKKTVKLLFVFDTDDHRKIKMFKKLSDSHALSQYILLDSLHLFKKSNSIPDDKIFHTFLVDKDHKVLAVGNSVLNPKVKDLYLKIINGGECLAKSSKKTLARIDKPNLFLGRFNGREEQKGEIILTNTGDEPLTITDAIPTCDCTSISFPKHPIAPGEQASLSVICKAEHPGKFEETVTVYGNIKGNTVKFKVSGEAE